MSLKFNPLVRRGLDYFKSTQQVTTADKTIYVRSTGSDTTGTGTSAKPYASVTKALSILPRRIEHKIKINLTEETLTDAFPSYIYFEFTGDGQLVFEAPLKESVGFSTLTVNTWTATGPALSYGGGEITFKNSPGLSTNVLANKYLQTSGGYIHRVKNNGSADARVMSWGYSLSEDDTLTVVESGCKFADSSGLIRTIRAIDLDSDPGMTSQSARIAFIGCEFTNSTSMLSVVDTCVFSTGSDLGHGLLERSALNTQSLPDMTAISTVALRDMWQLQATFKSLWVVDSSASLACTDDLTLKGRNTITYSTSLGECVRTTGGYSSISSCCFETTDNNGIQILYGDASISYCDFPNATNYALFIGYANVLINTCTNDDTAMSYAIGVGTAANIEMRSSSSMGGTTNDYRLTREASNYAWPSAGNSRATDISGLVYVQSS